MLAVMLSGCAGAGGFSSQDLRLEPAGATLYVFARSAGVSRNFCSSLGGDVSRVEGRSATASARTIQLGRVMGCYTMRHIIVCAEGDVACVALDQQLSAGLMN
jgi:hypothetical protein